MSDTPKVGDRFRHYANQHVYEVIAIDHDADNRPGIDNKRVRYRCVSDDDDGLTFSRSLPEWNAAVGEERRFIPVEPFDLNEFTVHVVLGTEDEITVPRQHILDLLAEVRKARRNVTKEWQRVGFNIQEHNLLKQNFDFLLKGYNKLRDHLMTAISAGKWNYEESWNLLFKLASEDFLVGRELRALVLKDWQRLVTERIANDEARAENERSKP